MRRLKQFLERYDAIERRRGQPFFLGNLASHWKPGRVKESKYYISEEQYEEPNYPNFVTGPNYLLSRSAVDLLLEAAWNQPYVPLEDVFFTGILPERLNRQGTAVRKRMVAELKNNGDRISVQFIGCTLLRSISIHKVFAEEQEELLKASRDPQCGPL